MSVGLTFGLRLAGRFCLGYLMRLQLSEGSAGPRGSASKTSHSHGCQVDAGGRSGASVPLRVVFSMGLINYHY